MYKDTIELFIDDLKFSSIAKLLKVADEHEDGYSVFTDSCRLISERTARTKHNGVSINYCEQWTSNFIAIAISCEYSHFSSLLDERQPSTHSVPLMDGNLRSGFQVVANSRELPLCEKPAPTWTPRVLPRQQFTLLDPIFVVDTCTGQSTIIVMPVEKQLVLG